MKQRCGLQHKSMDRVAKLAMERGLKHSDLSGQLRKWVDHVWARSSGANCFRLYGDKIYLFKGSKLITVMQIPNDLIKEVKRSKKRREENEINATSN